MRWRWGKKVKNMGKLGSKEGRGFLTVLKFGESREGEFMNKNLDKIM